MINYNSALIKSYDYIFTILHINATRNPTKYTKLLISTRCNISAFRYLIMCR